MDLVGGADVEIGDGGEIVGRLGGEDLGHRIGREGHGETSTHGGRLGRVEGKGHAEGGSAAVRQAQGVSHAWDMFEAE